ncbi:B-box zinc finger protein 21-like [Abrus precatorius]|uniref:B-box zinc finger protein 21-like n=1 Tax=Abrus precatorius TaxID=3816 RepID=A0A8B8KNA8_ABRPR|nr:B-box zinc finger protein 21-like [Abrus precatorius]
MKNCELCKVPARTFCESDQASLCWDCDAKVHGANFLVARHTRTLLCHTCQSLTPWKASGAALGNTVSLCERCAGGTKEQGEESEGGNDEDIYTDGEDDDEEDEDEEDEVVGDEDGDNQVVPWSSTAPPPAPSSSSSEESVSRCNNGEEDISQSVSTLKRRRQDDDFQGSNSWGISTEGDSELGRGGWLVRVRRRTAVEGVDEAGEGRRE